MPLGWQQELEFADKIFDGYLSQELAKRNCCPVVEKGTVGPEFLPKKFDYSKCQFFNSKISANHIIARDYCNKCEFSISQLEEWQIWNKVLVTGLENKK